MLHSWLCRNDYVADEDYEQYEDEGYNDDGISIVSSCMGSDSGICGDAADDDEHKDDSNSPEDLELWKALTVAEKGASTAEDLESLVNAKRRKFNKLALVDSFVDGNEILTRLIVKERQKAIRKMKRKFDLVQMSINYFNTMMEERRASLKHSIEKSKVHVFLPSKRDVEYRRIMKERRRLGLTNPLSK